MVGVRRFAGVGCHVQGRSWWVPGGLLALPFRPGAASVAAGSNAAVVLAAVSAGPGQPGGPSFALRVGVTRTPRRRISDTSMGEVTLCEERYVYIL